MVFSPNYGALLGTIEACEKKYREEFQRIGEDKTLSEAEKVDAKREFAKLCFHECSESFKAFEHSRMLCDGSEVPLEKPELMSSAEYDRLVGCFESLRCREMADFRFNKCRRFIAELKDAIAVSPDKLCG